MISYAQNLRRRRAQNRRGESPDYDRPIPGERTAAQAAAQARRNTRRAQRKHRTEERERELAQLRAKLLARENENGSAVRESMKTKT